MSAKTFLEPMECRRGLRVHNMILFNVYSIWLCCWNFPCGFALTKWFVSECFKCNCCCDFHFFEPKMDFFLRKTYFELIQITCNDFYSSWPNWCANCSPIRRCRLISTLILWRVCRFQYSNSWYAAMHKCSRLIMKINSSNISTYFSRFVRFYPTQLFVSIRAIHNSTVFRFFYSIFLHKFDESC